MRWYRPVFVNVSPSHKHPLSQFSCRDRRRFVTELLQANVNSVKSGSVDEAGMAGGPVKFPGLVKSGDLVVGPVDAGQRRQYRGLVRVEPSVAAAAGEWSWHAGHRSDAAALRGLCFRLRVPLVPAAGG